jgi:histidyl-tRNA synthetase
MALIDLQPVKGTRDFYPDDLRLRAWLFGLWREVARRYGFEEYDACVLEHEELYVRKAGDEISGQLYSFQDKADRRVALRPELTPSLARMVLAKGAELRLPARWFSIPQCFRYEKVQKGRKREHFQWNMDIVGLASVAAEAELMSAQVDFLGMAGFGTSRERPDVVLRVSDRRLLEHFLGDLGVSGDTFAAACVVIDKRDKIGNAAVEAELLSLGVPARTSARILELLDTKGLEAAAAKLSPENPGLAPLRELVELSNANGIGHLVQVDLSVVRGLSYYTGAVWEVFDTTGTVARAIGGGGRYDRLMQTYGGPDTPMVGFGMGDVVALEILRERGLLPALPRAVDDVVYPMHARLFPLANRVASALRKAGRAVLVDYTERRFKHVVERAERDGARRLLVLGDDEARDQACTIRALGGPKQEERVPLSSILG